MWALSSAYFFFQGGRARAVHPMQHSKALTGTPVLPEEVDTFWGEQSDKNLAFLRHALSSPDALGQHFENGSFALVFNVPNMPDKVAKITMGYDSGYATWMEKFVLLNQHNPHVPKVTLHVRLKNGQSITVMERLTEWDDVDDTPHVARNKKRLGTTFEELSEGRYEDILNMDLSEEELEIIEFLLSYGTNWIDTCPLNTMFRGNTHVYTDPMV